MCNSLAGFSAWLYFCVRSKRASTKDLVGSSSRTLRISRTCAAATWCLGPLWRKFAALIANCRGCNEHGWQSWTLNHVTVGMSLRSIDSSSLLTVTIRSKLERRSAWRTMDASKVGCNGAVTRSACSCAANVMATISMEIIWLEIWSWTCYEDNNENEKFLIKTKCLDLIISKRAQFFSDISETRFLKRILKTIAFLDSSHHTKICGHVISGSVRPTPKQHGKPQKSH